MCLIFAAAHVHMIDEISAHVLLTPPRPWGQAIIPVQDRSWNSILAC